MAATVRDSFDLAADILDPPASEDRDLAVRCATSLRTFIEQAWPIVEPGTAFKLNWHIDAICEYLEAVTRGELRKLIINVPPRHMKSSLIAVLWPAWAWLSTPSTKWLYVSYAAGLSKRDSLKCRRVVESMGGRTEGGTLIERVGYRGALGLVSPVFTHPMWALAVDQNEKMRFENTEAGYRLATSVEGSATGEGGDVVVVDDPHKAKEIESEVERLNVIDFLDGTLATRHNDPSTGATVLVMQRLHQQDATGHLLSQGGYEHLCLPAEYEPTHPFAWPDDPRTEPGDLLWPEHFTGEAVADLKLRLGSYRAAGQLQQRPSPAEGGRFKRHWWKRWTPNFEHTLYLGWDQVLQSWDMDFGSKRAGSSYVVGQVWGAHGADRYLLAQVRQRLSFTETTMAVQALTAFRPDSGAKLVEAKANGLAVVNTLRHKVSGLLPIEPDGGKEVRAFAMEPYVQAGNFYLPPTDFIPCPPPWTSDEGEVLKFEPTSTADFIEEHAQFPNGSNDDQVDGASQASNWLEHHQIHTGLDRSRHPDDLRREPEEPPGGAWEPGTAPDGDDWMSDLLDEDDDL